MWRGAIEAESVDDVACIQGKPKDVLELYRKKLNSFWIFPRVNGFDEINDKAKQVRKPALSIVAPLDINDIVEIDDIEFRKRIECAVGNVIELLK